MSCPTFLEFLTSLFNEGLQYRTINIIRSAVSTTASMTHNYTEGILIGKHPLISKFFREIHNHNPDMCLLGMWIWLLNTSNH